MSEFPNVLVGVGTQSQPIPPKQNYANLFTEYNMPSILQVESDPVFFNRIAKKETSADIPAEVEIYGFMEGVYSYTQANSINRIVDFFQQHNNIEIVICDILIDKGQYKTTQYTSPSTIQHNIPFFVRQSVASKINFINEPNSTLDQLKRLQTQHIIFHIAEPLLSITHRVMNE